METKQPISVRPHKPARPMKIVVDNKGDRWLCDAYVVPKGDLRARGCWRCGDLEMPFLRND
jgi:hypothetical protein